jgi:hypothetical protein
MAGFAEVTNHALSLHRRVQFKPPFHLHRGYVGMKVLPATKRVYPTIFYRSLDLDEGGGPDGRWRSPL